MLILKCTYVVIFQIDVSFCTLEKKRGICKKLTTFSKIPMLGMYQNKCENHAGFRVSH
jgi:hypothetical protein